jgi:hypothetical protein
MTRAGSLPVFLLSLTLVVGLFPMPGGAQEEGDAPPRPDPTDVESVDAIIRAVYEVISGPAGQVRDWDRFRTLFLPGARIIPAGGGAGGAASVRMMSPVEYAQSAGPYFLENGFFETEIGRVQERFGPIAHLFSAYQSMRDPDDAAPFSRGINSFQLMHDGARWWVVTIFFASEREDRPIPDRYLNKAPG